MGTDSMEANIRSETRHLPSISSTVSKSVVSQPLSVDQQILGPVCSDEDYTYIFPWAERGEH